MWEMEETPVESVQTALSFFSRTEESEKEGQVQNLLKQLEEKESSRKQMLLKLDHYQKTSEELSNLLKNSDLKKEFYINKWQEANVRMNELESKIEEMANKLSEHEITQKQLSHVSSLLTSTQGQILSKEAEIAELKRAQVESIIQIEAMESALSHEKLKTEGSLKHMSELNETIMHLKMKALEVEKEKENAVLEKEAELELAAKAAAEAQKQLEVMHDLENELRKKSAFIDSLELELTKSKDEVSELNTNVENMKSELEKIKTESVEVQEKENEAQIEIELLKSELKNERSKLAATAVSEVRSESEILALHNTLQQLALELEEAKKENQELEKAKKLADENKSDNILEPPKENHEKGREQESEFLKKELELAFLKIGELRIRAEQAISRAEAAEKAKAALDEEIRRQNERKERRKIAISALHEESSTKEVNSVFKHHGTVKNNRSLGKVLNIKL